MLHNGGNSEFAVFQIGLLSPRGADGQLVARVQAQRIRQQTLYTDFILRGGQRTLQGRGLVHGVGERLNVQYVAVTAHLRGAIGIVGTFHGGYAVHRGYGGHILHRKTVGEHQLQVVVLPCVQIAVHGAAQRRFVPLDAQKYSHPQRHEHNDGEK